MARRNEKDRDMREEARTVAKAALSAVPRKFGATDTVFDHAERVAARMGDRYEATVALLHDVVEDSPVTLDDLRATFGADVVADVDSLTRRAGERYFDYVARVAQGSAVARRVKLADLDDNSNPATPASLQRRYDRTRAMLTA